MIFGGARARNPVDQFAGMLPGIVSGYGGGTFDLRGRQVTPAALPAAQGLFPAPTQRGLPGSRPDGLLETEATNPGAAAPRPLDPVVSGDGRLPGQPAPIPSPQGRGIFGSSMRKPFDYDAVRAQLLPENKHSKTHNTIMTILDIAAPTLMALGGDQAGANAFIENLQRRRDATSQRRFEIDKTLAQWRHDDWARQNGADLDASAPFTIGRNRMQYDPMTGQVRPLYQGSADFGDYAAAQGLEPGTPEYFSAVEDYVLRGNGPTAFSFDKALDDHRTGNRLKLEGVRQGNRVSLEGVKQGNRVKLRGIPTYRDTHSGGGRAAMPTVSSPEEAMKLPPGTKFKTPDGQVRVRP